MNLNDWYVLWLRRILTGMEITESLEDYDYRYAETFGYVVLFGCAVGFIILVVGMLVLGEYQ